MFERADDWLDREAVVLGEIAAMPRWYTLKVRHGDLELRYYGPEHIRGGAGEFVVFSKGSRVTFAEP